MIVFDIRKKPSADFYIYGGLFLSTMSSKKAIYTVSAITGGSDRECNGRLRTFLSQRPEPIEGRWCDAASAEEHDRVPNICELLPIKADT